MKRTKLEFSNTQSTLHEKAQKEKKKWMWIILMGCFLFQMIPYCIALNLTGVFAGKEWLNWTHNNQQPISLTFTIGAVVSGLLGPFIAKIFTRKNINQRFIYILGITLAMLGFMGYSINTLIPSNSSVFLVSAILWISNIFVQVGVVLFSVLGINNLISKWWPPERRGFALGFAFAGGSFGSIWFQMIVKELVEYFGNSKNDYTSFNNQYATYLILGIVGIVFGITIALFICRRPIPEISDHTLGNKLKNKNIKSKIILANSTKKNKNKTNINNLGVSPIVTRKYPIYWTLCIGYFFIQLGSIHLTTNTLFINKATLLNSPNEYTDIVSLGLVIYAISCLFGNSCGGIINDKFGVNKSILLGGILQCIAVFMLMNSVNNKNLVYVYYCLSGLSIYLFTSTPAFLCGKLYGSKQGNKHLAIIGIFIAFGFALGNSIIGSITGYIDNTNIHQMFGKPTYGNFFALGMVSIVALGIGTLVVFISSTIILNKGVKGLLNYSPTKFTKLIIFKYKISLFLRTNFIFFIKNQYNPIVFNEKSDKEILKIKSNIKKETNRYQNKILKINKNVDSRITNLNSKLNSLYNLKINDEIHRKNVLKSAKLSTKYENNKINKNIKMQKKNKSKWYVYKVNYYLDQKINNAKIIANTQKVNINVKISAIKNKIEKITDIYNYNLEQELKGNNGMIKYYTNQDKLYYELLSNSIDDKFDKKINILNNRKDKFKYKYSKLKDTKKLF